MTNPGGKIIVINPISWSHHDAPVDCWRIHAEGMRTLCTEAGLTVIVCQEDALEPRSAPRRPYWGNSYYQPPSEATVSTKAKALMKAAIRWPVETPLDLITIPEKPLSTILAS